MPYLSENPLVAAVNLRKYIVDHKELGSSLLEGVSVRM